MSRSRRAEVHPGEVRQRKYSGGVLWDDRSGGEQIRILTSQYERGLIELPELEEKLEAAVAKEATESSVATDLRDLAPPPAPPSPVQMRPFPTNAVPLGRGVRK